MANGELLTLAYGLYFAGITLGELICELGNGGNDVYVAQNEC